jgi:ferredoxin-NADP reductase
MRITLQEQRQETSDVMSFVFDLNGQLFTFKAGQFVFFELDELAFPDERGKRRHFTISSAPSEQGRVMFTTRLRGSGFKETLRHAPIGYALTLETPRGGFTIPDEGANEHVFIAGGIGITPYRSILREAFNTQQSINATLFYFNRTIADIVFGRELADLAQAMPSFKCTHVLSEPERGWNGETGRLSEALLQRHAPNFKASWCWLSGPPPMVNAYKELLLQAGVSEDNLKTDSFTGY